MQASYLNDELFPIIAQFLGLPHLASHLSTVILSFCLWNAIQYVLSPLVLSQLSAKYINLDPKNRAPAPISGSTLKEKQNPRHAKSSLNGWHTRAVSMLHALIVLPLAIDYLNLPALSGPRDRAFGWEERIGSLHGIACGCASSLHWKRTSLKPI